MTKYWVLRVSGCKRSELAPPSSLIKKGWNVKRTTEMAKNDSQRKIFGVFPFLAPSVFWKSPSPIGTQVHKFFTTEISELFCPNIANPIYWCIRQRAIFSEKEYPYKTFESYVRCGVAASSFADEISLCRSTAYSIQLSFRSLHAYWAKSWLESVPQVL